MKGLKREKNSKIKSGSSTTNNNNNYSLTHNHTKFNVKERREKKKLNKYAND